MKFKSLAMVAAVGLICVAAMGAASAEVYEQSYVVTLTVKPNDGGEPSTASEVWSTQVYRDGLSQNLVLRNFGEALNFSVGGEQFFLLKRGANSTSAGTYDIARECLGIRAVRDYASAPDLLPCEINSMVPMVVKASTDGKISQIRKNLETGTYPDFELSLHIAPTHAKPSFGNVEQFPWIDNLPTTERTSAEITIPESGYFAGHKFYRKDFILDK